MSDKIKFGQKRESDLRVPVMAIHSLMCPSCTEPLTNGCNAIEGTDFAVQLKNAWLVAVAGVSCVKNKPLPSDQMDPDDINAKAGIAPGHVHIILKVREGNGYALATAIVSVQALQHAIDLILKQMASAPVICPREAPEDPGSPKGNVKNN